MQCNGTALPSGVRCKRHRTADGKVTSRPGATRLHRGPSRGMIGHARAYLRPPRQTCLPRSGDQAQLLLAEHRCRQNKAGIS